MLYALSAFAMRLNEIDSDGVPETVHVSGYAYANNENEAEEIALAQFEAKLSAEEGWSNYTIKATEIPTSLLSSMQNLVEEGDVRGTMFGRGLAEDFVGGNRVLQFVHLPMYTCTHKGKPTICDKDYRHTKPFYICNYVDENTPCPECTHPGTLVP